MSARRPRQEGALILGGPLLLVGPIKAEISRQRKFKASPSRINIKGLQFITPGGLLSPRGTVELSLTFQENKLVTTGFGVFSKFV